MHDRPMGETARLPGAPARGIFRRLVYWVTRRKVGHVVMPIQVAAYNPKILFGLGIFEQSLASAHTVDARLKGLAQMRVAGRVGCPF
jgi:hypothetical protein